MKLIRILAVYATVFLPVLVIALIFVLPYDQTAFLLITFLGPAIIALLYERRRYSKAAASAIGAHHTQRDALRAKISRVSATPGPARVSGSDIKPIWESSEPQGQVRSLAPRAAPAPARA
ncbi:MAG: hypothetical protein JJU26_00425 [Oceanicaulis sp.]|uniref:hypothetical protein n=1 Tax=Glycocaulis sp. TaxID=1969725 RepID=UPI0025BF2C31|nr:hypothetical protein [Glycocaulis sp.]MCC5980161.1 hypothetical protein [Oceanicaulis sp.]MCH8521953.1 hypothetical protein [Glycocaulis sp.]